jgi:hypothetical protein
MVVGLVNSWQQTGGGGCKDCGVDWPTLSVPVGVFAVGVTAPQGQGLGNDITHTAGFRLLLDTTRGESYSAS